MFQSHLRDECELNGQNFYIWYLNAALGRMGVFKILEKYNLRER